MSACTSGDYVYFENTTDITNEHHNCFIFNQILDRFITSPLKFIDEIFESFSKLCVDQMKKMDECPYPNCGPVIKSQFMEQRESTNGKNL